MLTTSVRFAYRLIGTLGALHFLFILTLSEHISGLSVALFTVCVIAVLPPVQRRIRQLPLLGRDWFFGCAFLILIFVANVQLERGNRPEIVHGEYAFAHATLITGELGAAPISDAVILVDVSGEIVEVGTSASLTIPDGYETIDLSGKFLLPGLINAHGHLVMSGSEPGRTVEMTRFGPPEWVVGMFLTLAPTYAGEKVLVRLMERNAMRALRAGITTVRGLGDPEFYDVVLRKQIESGRSLGPRLLVAGPLLCTTGGHARQIGITLDGPDEARRAVRTSLSHEVDVIKIASTGGVADSKRLGEAGELQMTPEEISAITDEAHRKGVLVTAHAESAEGVLEALRAGIDNIEHGAELDDEALGLFLNNPRSLRGFTSLHPTLSVISSNRTLNEEGRKNRALYIRYMNGQQVSRDVISGYKSAVAAGVKIGVGTDGGLVDHASVWRELEFMIQHGNITNERAIHIGTLATAESIGIEATTGSIEIGKAADFMVVDANPFEELSTLDNPHMVVAAGSIVDRH
ncbi:MAG: amidohydrolase family protein [Pseudomonadales bacterium]|nr:hypothetical protein [Gammaproteobacteria bacterium]MDP6025229.1 amidohydrolase family protein [Pseudomonadales bacterium]MDP6315328.1 amidohydrolase family protein [Pseudomonadales bacterium]MDP7314776.1 amidohydrolase family protein [Pseudomonadales bacterium]